MTGIISNDQRAGHYSKQEYENNHKKGNKGKQLRMVYIQRGAKPDETDLINGQINFTYPLHRTAEGVPQRAKYVEVIVSL